MRDDIDEESVHMDFLMRAAPPILAGLLSAEPRGVSDEPLAAHAVYLAGLVYVGIRKLFDE